MSLRSLGSIELRHLKAETSVRGHESSCVMNKLGFCFLILQDGVRSFQIIRIFQVYRLLSNHFNSLVNAYVIFSSQDWLDESYT